MKINWNYIKAFLVLGLVVFLFGFAEKRNNNRKINNVAINFVDDENLYVTHEIVNKLLIQNNEKVKNASKEAIALKDVENRIDNHDMIADSIFYVFQSYCFFRSVLNLFVILYQQFINDFMGNI